MQQDRWDDPVVTKVLGDFASSVVKAWTTLRTFHQEWAGLEPESAQASLTCGHEVRDLSGMSVRVIRKAMEEPNCPTWLLGFLKDDMFRFIHAAHSIAGELQDEGHDQLEKLAETGAERVDLDWHLQSLRTQFKAYEILLDLRFAMSLVGLPVGVDEFELGQWGG